MDRPDPLAFVETQLAHGSRTYWHHDPLARSVCLGVIVGAGSIDDPSQYKGIAHLFEHFDFAGTTKFASTKALAASIEDLGGAMNASVGAAKSSFFLETEIEHGPRAADSLDQIVNHQLVRPTDLRRAKSDVKSEIVANENSWPSLKMKRVMNTHLFGRKLARTTDFLGTPRSLSRIDIEAIRNFQARWYHPANTIWVACGNLSGFPGSWPTWIHQRLQGYRTRNGSIGLHRRLRPSPVSHPVWLEVADRSTAAPRVVVTVRLHDYDHRPISEWDDCSRQAELLNFMLVSKGISSYLHDLLRTQHTLLYELDSDVGHFSGSGFHWTLQSVLKQPAGVLKFFQLLRSVMTDRRNFNMENVERAKRGMLGRWAMNPMTPGDVFSWAIDHLSRGLPIPTLQQLEDGYRKVTVRDIQGLVKRDFNPDRWIVVYQK